MHATLEDLAKAEGVGKTYASQVLGLTMLAPEIVEAILDGRQPAELQLDRCIASPALEAHRDLSAKPYNKPLHVGHC